MFMMAEFHRFPAIQTPFFSILADKRLAYLPGVAAGNQLLS